jgi:hypothetical protein
MELVYQPFSLSVYQIKLQRPKTLQNKLEGLKYKKNSNEIATAFGLAMTLGKGLA